MQLEKTEAIVLRSLTYKDDERILTLFTKDLGIASLLVKRVSARNFQKVAVTSPFCQAEFLYLKGESDLLLYRDSSLVSEHLELRKKLSSLQLAGSLIQALLHSQLPGKPAPALYALLERYLKQVPAFDDALPLSTSFFLKILAHEGVLSFGALSISEEEQELLVNLLETRSFEKLKTIRIPEALGVKVELHLKNLYH